MLSFNLMTCIICNRVYQFEKLCAEQHEGKTHVELLRYFTRDPFQWSPENTLTCMCCCLALKVSFYFLKMIWEKNGLSDPFPQKLQPCKILDEFFESSKPLVTVDSDDNNCRMCHNSCGNRALSGQQPVLTWLEKYIPIDLKVCARCSKALQVFQILIMHVRKSENLFLNSRAQNIIDSNALSEVDGEKVDINSNSNYEDGFNEEPCEFSPTHFQTEEVPALATNTVQPLAEELVEERENEGAEEREKDIQECTKLGGEYQMEDQDEEIIEMPVILYKKPAFQCSQCERQFSSQKSMRIHITTKHRVATGCRQQSKGCFICQTCGKKYNFKCQLGSHQRFCTKRKSVPCNFCKESFVDVAMFERHIRTNHNIEVTHQCEVCSAQFKTAVLLARHRLRHSERYAECKICQRTYINQAELKIHMESKHGVEKKYTCQYCTQKFTNIQQQRMHERQQHTPNFLKCGYCDFLTTSYSSMRVHRFRHTGKPYKCRMCDKTYESRSRLRQHAARQHEIQISDEECSKQFRERYGRISRHDAFSASLNSLKIEDIDEELIESELQREFNTSLDTMSAYLFQEGQ